MTRDSPRLLVLAFLLTVAPLLAVDAPAGTIRFYGLVREIDWCEEAGGTIRCGVQGVTYTIRKQDVEAIALVCPVAEPPSTTLVPARTATRIDLGRSDFPFTPYLRQIQTKIRGRWTPPRDASRGSRAVILFSIARDGRTIGEPVVETTSGNQLLDESALRAV